MRKRSVRTVGLGIAGVVVGFGGVASWAIGLSPSPNQAEMSPAQLIALRFLEVDFSRPVPTDDSTVPTMLLASVGEPKPVRVVMINPKAEAAAKAEPAAKPVAELPKPAPKVAAIPLPVARPAAAPRTIQVAHAVKAAHPARPGSVLTDTQIASIRKRLRLTPDQEEMWPAVELALRNLSYAKTASATPATGGQLAYVDPDSDEVRRLKSAAFPLIMRLNDDQRQEVKNLATVMGLTSVASRL